MNVKIIFDTYYAVPDGRFRALLRCEPVVFPSMELLVPDALENGEYFRREVRWYSSRVLSVIGPGGFVDVESVLCGTAVNAILDQAVYRSAMTSALYERRDGLFVPASVAEDNPMLWPGALRAAYGNGFSLGFDFSSADTEPSPPPPEPEFEVNLTEALVGWKRWLFDPRQRVLVTSHKLLWHPLQQVTAVCYGNSYNFLHNRRLCPKSPVESCTCGIYAVDSEDGIPDYGDGLITIDGEVYGWGRYVRGDVGWRAQFAYPKSFMLTDGQSRDEALCLALMEYRVPISARKPVKIYNPEDDGYAGGQNAENWDSRTDSESGAAEGEGAGNDEED
jgi:hypothetical protein